jgi:heat shock protein HslJ
MRWAIERKGTTLKFGILTAAMAMVLAAPIPALAAEFPYDQEMLLDAKPLAGSKRVPTLEVGIDGRAQIDLWCRSGPAQVEVTGAAITITVGALREEGCTAERSGRDQELITALTGVTQWRVEDDVVVLSGPTELRFYLSTH